MYDRFYHFAADPFRLSPDHAFCYRHPSYAKGRAYMEYALDAAEGFVVVTGKPGMGKTTLINDLLANTSLSKYLAASIVTTRLDADDLLRSIAYEFSLNVENADKATVIQKLKRLFVLSTRNARPPLLIVDEAQNLTLGALEELRLLTNMQYEGLPLLQIFLLGQDELREKLLDPKLEQLRQRISAATQLEPLSEEHTGSYIVHRLRVVGWKNHPRISRAAVAVLHETCQGVPRRINQFCSRLFLLAAGEERDRLTADDARQVAFELSDEGLTPSSAEFLRDGSSIDDSEDLGEGLFVESDKDESNPKEAPESSDPDVPADTYPGLSDKVLGLSGRGVEDKRGRRDSPPVETPLPSPGEAPARVEAGGLATSPLAQPQVGLQEGITRGNDGETPEIAAFLRASAANDNIGGPPKPPRPGPRSTAASADDWPDEDDFDDDDRPRRGITAFRVALLLLLIAAAALFYFDWRNGLKDWFAANSVDFMSQMESMRESSLLGDRPPDREATTIERLDPFTIGPAAKTVAGDVADVESAGEPVVSIPATTDPGIESVADIDTVADVEPGQETGPVRSEPNTPALTAPAGSLASAAGEPAATGTTARIPPQPAVSAPPVESPGPETQAGAVLRRVEEVQFGFDSARLDDEARQALDRVVRTLGVFESSVAILLGYADSTGPAAYNRRLSVQRAEVVAGYLAGQEVDADRLLIGESAQTALEGIPVPRPLSERSVQVIIVGRP